MKKIKKPKKTPLISEIEYRDAAACFAPSAAAVLAAVLAFASCAKSSPPPEQTASAAPARPAVAPLASHAAPSTATATASPSPFPRPPGIGTTRVDWEATHTHWLRPGVAPTEFGPLFASPKSEGGQWATYVNVSGDDRILSYNLDMPPTTFEKARLRLISELPADAVEVKRRVLRPCRQIRYRSATLDAIFAKDPVARATGYSGQVEAEFVSEDPEVMNPAAVNRVIVGFSAGEDVDC